MLLVLLTLAWGLNWPVMKFGVTGYPPLAFRAMSMWLGLPVLWAMTIAMKVDLRIARRDWGELVWLSVINMLVWHVLAILSVQELSSGRAAILGYTMPIWSALWGLALYRQRLQRRQIFGIAAAGLGVVLLVWHELGGFAGKPWAALGMLVAAAVWALGTQQLRRTRIEAPTLAIVFWMTLITTLGMTVLTVLFERPRWHAPTPGIWAAIGITAIVKKGAPLPDLSSVEKTRAAMLASRKLALAPPGVPPRGTHMGKVLEQLGIADAVKSKLIPRPALEGGVELVESGEAELGFYPKSEVIGFAGLSIAGPLPAEIQLTTIYGAAVTTLGKSPDAAAVFIVFMTDPRHRAAWSAGGFDPAS